MKLAAKQVEELAVEIRQFLLDNNIWQDTTIYFNGKAFSTDDRQGNYFYNDPEHLVVLENQDPADYFTYTASPHILSMSFEGPLLGCLNYHNEYGAAFDNRIQTELAAILDRHGLYYELGDRWNLSCYPVL